MKNNNYYFEMFSPWNGILVKLVNFECQENGNSRVVDIYDRGYFAKRGSDICMKWKE